MYHYAAIALGGALGALSRYWLTSVAERFNQTQFPFGTFAVNVLGSLLVGALFVILTEKIQLAEQLRPVLLIGFLGAFTTFSAFSLESVLLMQHGQFITALSYIVLSVVTCLTACWLGISVTRTLII